jgi:D-beta-D-heptose 7-phosphate kinase/D-beta-D-heptose 1-phosphate adenosyltransferase
MKTRSNHNKILDKFHKKRILVVGDPMLDQYIRGEVSRISPEAPVPVVKVAEETCTLGGAGNVANNLSAIGVETSIAGVVGNDNFGEIVKKELEIKGISTEGLLRTDRQTTVKTRIIARHQQVTRVDREADSPLAAECTHGLLRYIRGIAREMDAMIISDYGKGVITPAVIKELTELSARYNIPLTVDPKVEHFRKYKGVTCITPNTNEMMASMHVAHLETEEDLKRLGRRILNTLRCQSLLVTRGEKGMTLFEGRRAITIPTQAKDVYDVTGAGDTVIAIFTACLATGASFEDAARISNCGAGIVVGKLGTATVSLEELREALDACGVAKLK